MTKSAGAALISLVLLASCAPRAITVSFPVAGGQRIRFEKVGSSFGRAEDSRFVITESGLTTYREGGRNYLRWQFGFRVKQPLKLQSVVVEEVSGTQPVLILKDLAPEVAGIEWTKQSGLTPAGQRRGSRGAGTNVGRTTGTASRAQAFAGRLPSWVVSGSRTAGPRR